MQQANPATPKLAAECEASAGGGPISVTPELIQQLLDHDYLKLKIKAQVDEITSAKLRRWRAGLLGGASAAVVILGYLGIQANQVVSDFNHQAAKVHEMQDKMQLAQGKVESDSNRVTELIDEAKENAQRSTNLVSSSQEFLRDNIRQMGSVNQAADNLRTEGQRLRDVMETGRAEMKRSASQVNATLAKVEPLVPEMAAVTNAAEEARRAGMIEIVFLESRSERSIELPDYKDPTIRYQVRFVTNRINSRASLDVETKANGQEYPVQHLVNLSAGQIRSIEHTPLQVEVSALRHHRQPFLHSFLILRVMSNQPDSRPGVSRAALTGAKQETN